MNHDSAEPTVATAEEVKKSLRKLKKVDVSSMLDCIIKIPDQIIEAIEASKGFYEGDHPLDRKRVYIVGLGGSAIAGELLSDMLAPRDLISVFRGTQPPRDKRPMIVSSYSGNTSEIVNLAHKVTGGLRTLVFMTSGGTLGNLGKEWYVPVWSIPEGYQPRAAIGWSITLSLAALEKWHVVHNEAPKLVDAAKRLKVSLDQIKLHDHILTQAALPIAKACKNKHTVIFHSSHCAGAARRLSSQICENANQPVCTHEFPEALHNTIQGYSGGKADRWTMLFMTDPGDTDELRESIEKTSDYFSELGFNCLPFPSAGKDPFELTLSRLMLADFISILLAGEKGVDPTPIEAINALKITIEPEPEPEYEVDEEAVTEEEELEEQALDSENEPKE